MRCLVDSNRMICVYARVSQPPPAAVDSAATRAPPAALDNTAARVPAAAVDNTAARVPAAAVDNTAARVPAAAVDNTAARVPVAAAAVVHPFSVALGSVAPRSGLPFADLGSSASNGLPAVARSSPASDRSLPAEAA